MDKKEQLEKLSNLVKEAREALKRAELFANEHGLDFDFRPAYGMGGTFYGEKHPDLESLDEYRIHDGWISSSSGC